jgi:hypothetical protein
MEYTLGTVRLRHSVVLKAINEMPFSKTQLFLWS